jgi:arginase family enzyme
MHIRILDLDGGLLPQTELRSRYHAEVVGLSSWGPRIRLACSFARFAAFERALDQALNTTSDNQPSITFYGSGDFHHVTLALLRRLRGPFNLLVLDNHPDWMRHIPFLHCGTWLAHAARLPQVQRIFHVGGDVDFDNFYRILAPWKLLAREKIVVFPAVRRYRAGKWAEIANSPVRHLPRAPVRKAVVSDLLLPFRAELARLPLYISLDKDVLVPGDAVVNWDSGHLTLGEVQGVLGCFVEAAEGNLAGMDVLGEWSPVHVDSIFRRWFHWTMHPAMEVNAAEANRINERTNLAVLETLQAAMPRRRVG